MEHRFTRFLISPLVHSRGLLIGLRGNVASWDIWNYLIG